MNIVFVTYHTCARADKMARALLMAGHQVIVLQHIAASETILYGQMLSSFYHNKQDLKAKIGTFNDWADIYHVHNEPDWPVATVAQAAEVHIPVVYDCHDLESQRHGEATKDEVAAFFSADACIFPSLAYAYGATKYHKIERDDKPVEVVFSMCLKDDQVLIDHPKIDAIVYEGHHIGPLPGTDFQPGHPKYYDYRGYLGFVEECSARDIPMSMIGTRKDFAPAYRQAGALVTPMLPFHDMMKELTRYSWGFCGHPDSHAQWERAMPNKLFEYLSAGLPIIAWNCQEIEMWVQAHAIGVVVNSYDELKQVFKSKIHQKKYAARVQEMLEAAHFNMEIQVPKIVALYEKAIKEKLIPWKSTEEPSKITPS